MDADAVPPRRADRRLLALAALSVVCVLVAVGYVALAARRTDLRAVAAAPTAAPDTLAAVSAQPHVMFLESQGDAFRRVALAPLDGIDGGRVLTNLQCQRERKEICHARFPQCELQPDRVRAGSTVGNHGAVHAVRRGDRRRWAARPEG